MALGIVNVYLGSPFSANWRYSLSVCSQSVGSRSVGSRSVCRCQLWTHLSDSVAGFDKANKA